MMDWNAYGDQVNAAVMEISTANPEIVKAFMPDFLMPTPSRCT
jgi:hypothetical protein